MADNGIQARRRAYFALSSALAQTDQRRLQDLLDAAPARAGWGESQVIALGRRQVFVKRIPVTDIERGSLYSTANLYGLPAYYNYGFGSAGMGVFRELATHVKTTNWVLEGAIAHFPLLYHHRIVPRATTSAVDPERHAAYVASWGGHASIGRYLLDRASASHELILFLEHIPHTAADWLPDHQRHMPMVLRDMRAAIAFLRRQGIIHLDTDFSNVLTDGRRAYLTDFGLALDRHFDLSPAEAEFHRRNAWYDYGNLAWSLGLQLFLIYRRLPEADQRFLAEACGIAAGSGFEAIIALLLGHLDDLAASGRIPLDRGYVASLKQYRDLILFINAFYAGMRANPRKDTPLRPAALRRLLAASGFIRAAPPGGKPETPIRADGGS